MTSSVHHDGESMAIMMRTPEMGVRSRMQPTCKVQINKWSAQMKTQAKSLRKLVLYWEVRDAGRLLASYRLSIRFVLSRVRIHKWKQSPPTSPAWICCTWRRSHRHSPHRPTTSSDWMWLSVCKRCAGSTMWRSEQYSTSNLTCTILCFALVLGETKIKLFFCFAMVFGPVKTNSFAFGFVKTKTKSCRSASNQYALVQVRSAFETTVIAEHRGAFHVYA